MMNKTELLDLCTVKTATFKSKVLNDKTIKIKELTINEAEEFNKLQQDSEVSQFDAICSAVRYSMCEPTFFTDEELKNITTIGKEFIYEVFSEIPLIGKDEAQRKEHFKRLKELVDTKTKDGESVDDKSKDNSKK